MQRRAEWQTTDAAQWCRVCASSCTAKEGKRAALAQGGNTCWLSAILQLFFHSRSFAVWEQARTCCCRSVGCFSCHMALTFRETTEPGAKRSLQDWQSIATAIFMARGQQQDAAEFFNLLTAKWAERKNSRCRKDGALFAEPYLLEMFHERKKLHACECKQPGTSVSTRVERMLGMMLPLSKSSCPTSVQKLIHEQFADEAEESTSQGDRCASCGGQPTVIHRSHFKDVSQLQTLYIHLKRVDAEGRKSRREVLVNTYVILPGKAFRLVGIATHLGDDANGHYMTWIRARHEYNIYDDGKTYLFRDKVLPQLVKHTAVAAIFEPTSFAMTVFENSSSWQQMLCQLEVARMAQTCTALRSVPQFMAWGVPYVPLDNQEVAANEGNIDGAHAGPEEDGTETDEDNEDDPGVDKGFAGEVALDDGKYLPEATCPLQQFNEDVQTLLEVFAEKGTEKDCCQFLSSLSDEHGDLHRLGPRALIVRFSKMLQCIVNSRTTVDEAVKMYVPFWMCHGYRMCVLCEAVSRASALPAPFFLDALRNAAVSVIHKEVHVTCMGYECRARPWTFGVGDPATGKSHAVDPHMSMVEAACNMDSSYAPGTADDHFHLVHSRTYAALESKITKTGGYGLKLSGEGHQYCNDTYAKKGHFDDSKGLRFDLMMDMSSGGRFGGGNKGVA